MTEKRFISDEEYEERFEADGSCMTNQYDYSTLMSRYEANVERNEIIEWNKDRDNAQYVGLERIAEELNFKELQLENCRKGYEKLVNENEQLKSDKQNTINYLREEYNYVNKQRQKNLDKPLLAKACELVCYDIKKILNDLGVDLDRELLKGFRGGCRMTEKRYIYASVGVGYEILDSWFGYIGDSEPTEREIEEYDYLVIGLAPDQDSADGICRRLNDQQDEINHLSNFGLHVILDKKNKENEQLKSTIKEVTELLSDEVDLFSDKATEHDINAYVELKELDNKDAFYMATATKKAIKMLKELQRND